MSLKEFNGTMGSVEQVFNLLSDASVRLLPSPWAMWVCWVEPVTCTNVQDGGLSLLSEEGFSAQRTGGLVAGREPFIQASRVKLLLAGAAGFLGQRVVGAVDDRETDHAILHTLESLINVVLP